MKEDLLWWQHPSSIGKNPLRLRKFKIELSSDASLTGWGAHCEGKSAHEFWSKIERKFSINYLELLAAFFALQCFVSHCTNCEVLIRIDNTSAISYINKQAEFKCPT